jgi:hypothetical protein
MAQGERPLNLRKFDRRMFHFGFMLGSNYSTFGLQRKYAPGLTDSVISMTTKGSVGFNLGVITSLKLLPVLRLRFVPSLSFQERSVNYEFMESGGFIESQSQSLKATSLDFPLLLKFRTLRITNFAAYIIGGAQYSYDLSSNQDDEQVLGELMLKTKKHDWQGQIGIGFDFFLQYFKFGFEVKYSHSFKSILYDDDTYLSRPVDNLYNRVWWFSITFEG